MGNAALNTQTHTPAPWELEILADSCGNYFTIWAGKAIKDRYTKGVWSAVGEIKLYEDVDYPSKEYGEYLANARLIAAAPDLLAALQGVLRVADRKTDEFDAARAAIAKALTEKEGY